MYNDLIGEIVCLVTSNGDMIGKMVDGDERSVLLESPRAFMQTEKGMGFAPCISVGCAEVDRARYNLNLVLTATPAHKEVQRAWRQMTSGIVMP